MTQPQFYTKICHASEWALNHFKTDKPVHTFHLNGNLGVYGHPDAKGVYAIDVNCDGKIDFETNGHNLRAYKQVDHYVAPQRKNISPRKAHQAITKLDPNGWKFLWWIEDSKWFEAFETCHEVKKSDAPLFTAAASLAPMALRSITGFLGLFASSTWASILETSVRVMPVSRVYETGDYQPLFLYDKEYSQLIYPFFGIRGPLFEKP